MFDFFKEFLKPKPLLKRTETEEDITLGKYQITIRMMNGNEFGYTFEEYLYNNLQNKYDIDREMGLIRVCDCPPYFSSMFTFTDAKGDIVMVQNENVERVFVRKLSEATAKIKRITYQ